LLTTQTNDSPLSNPAGFSETIARLVKPDIEKIYILNKQDAEFKCRLISTMKPVFFAMNHIT